MSEGGCMMNVNKLFSVVSPKANDSSERVIN